MISCWRIVAETRPFSSVIKIRLQYNKELDITHDTISGRIIDLNLLFVILADHECLKLVWDLLELWSPLSHLLLVHASLALKLSKLVFKVFLLGSQTFNSWLQVTLLLFPLLHDALVLIFGGLQLLLSYFKLTVIHHSRQSQFSLHCKKLLLLCSQLLHQTPHFLRFSDEPTLVLFHLSQLRL